MFSGCTMPSDSKETKLGSSNQRLLPHQVKILGCFSAVSDMEVKCVSTTISVGVDISDVHVYHLLQQMSSQ